MTVQPREIDDVLDNPGMGFCRFHFGFGHPPKPDEYPHTTVAYFRWPWRNWNRRKASTICLGGRVIAQAKAKGRPSPSRIVSEYKTGTPKWVLDKGVSAA